MSNEMDVQSRGSLLWMAGCSAANLTLAVLETKHLWMRGVSTFLGCMCAFAFIEGVVIRYGRQSKDQT